MEYLLFVRLREAMRLLDTTENSVTDISLAVGFNSINHFIRAFKQHLYITPKQYQLKKKTTPTN
jgi:AraC-like DNA-binding protein